MTFAEIKNILSQISDPAERLEFVMDLGNQNPSAPCVSRGREIKGCASRVEICRDENNNFAGFADSAIVRGILQLLLAAVHGKSRDEIREMDLIREFESLDLQLGAGRMNGVAAIVDFLENN